MAKEDEMAIGIGARVRAQRKAEHDEGFGASGLAVRAAFDGKTGTVDDDDAEAGGFYVLHDGDHGAWWRPDELTEIASEPMAGEVAAEVIAEMQANPTNPILQDLRDELANEKAAHAEAERLLSEARANLADHVAANHRLADLAREQEQARIEAERRENEARADREHVEEAAARAGEEASRARRDAQEARDRLSRVKTAVDALRGVSRNEVYLDEYPAVLAAFDAVDRALAGVEARPVLTEEEAKQEVRALMREVLAPANLETVLQYDERPLVRLLMRNGAVLPREPVAEQPRTDLGALADAIEANGRTWQRVEPSTVARALRAVDRRMGTLEAAVTALAASVEQVQAKAGIGEAANKPIDPLIDHGVGVRPEHANLPRCPKCDVRHPLEWLCPMPASPRQGDGSGRLVLGHIDGQPIRARYTGVTPTEPRKP